MREESINPLSEQERTAAQKALLGKFELANDPFETPRVFKHKIRGFRSVAWYNMEISEILGSLFPSTWTSPLKLAILVIDERLQRPFCMHLEPGTRASANLRLLGNGTDLLDLGEVMPMILLKELKPEQLRRIAAGFNIPKSDESLRRFGSIEMRLRFNDNTPDVRRHLCPEEVSALCDAIALQAHFDQEADQR